MHQPAVREGDRDIFYGMGWESRTLAGVPVVRHKGTNANFYADMVLDKEDRWGIVILANLDSLNFNGGRLQGLSAGVLSLLRGEAPPDVPMPHHPLLASATLLIAAVTVLMLSGMAWSLATLRRWRAQPESSTAPTLGARPAGSPVVGDPPRLGSRPVAHLPGPGVSPGADLVDRAGPWLPDRDQQRGGAGLGYRPTPADLLHPSPPRRLITERHPLWLFTRSLMTTFSNRPKKENEMPKQRMTQESAPPRTDRPLRQILVFLLSTYAIAVAIALALPHAGINTDAQHRRANARVRNHHGGCRPPRSTTRRLDGCRVSSATGTRPADCCPRTGADRSR